MKFDVMLCSFWSVSTIRSHFCSTF